MQSLDRLPGSERSVLVVSNGACGETSALNGEWVRSSAQAASTLRPRYSCIRFGCVFWPGQPVCILKTIDELLCAATKLQDDDPGSACQILLMSAAYQDYSGGRDDALRTAEQALALAEHNGLAKERTWAAWGACAICFQAENYERAAKYLELLQAGLSDQDEWVLADFVEVVRQSLLHPGSLCTGEGPGSCPDLSGGDMFSLTFDGLRQWGIAPQASGRKLEMNAGLSMPPALPHGRLTSPSLSSQHGRRVWDSPARGQGRDEPAMGGTQGSACQAETFRLAFHIRLTAIASAWCGC